MHVYNVNERSEVFVLYMQFEFFSNNNAHFFLVPFSSYSCDGELLVKSFSLGI